MDCNTAEQWSARRPKAVTAPLRPEAAGHVPTCCFCLASILIFARHLTHVKVCVVLSHIQVRCMVGDRNRNGFASSRLQWTHSGIIYQPCQC